MTSLRAGRHTFIGWTGPAQTWFSAPRPAGELLAGRLGFSFGKILSEQLGLDQLSGGEALTSPGDGMRRAGAESAEALQRHRPGSSVRESGGLPATLWRTGEARSRRLGGRPGAPQDVGAGLRPVLAGHQMTR
jgi:hypothetical protein